MSGGGIYKELSSAKDANDFIFSLFICQSALSLLFCFLYLAFSNQINLYTGLSTHLSLLLILQIFFNSIESLYLSLCRYFSRYKTVFFINTGLSLTTALLSLFFIRTLSLYERGRIYAPLIASLIFIFPVIAIYFSQRRHFDFSVFRYFKKTLLPLLPHYFAASLTAQFPKILISKQLGGTAAGSFGAASSLSLGMSVLTLGLSGAFFPWINRVFSENNATRMASTLKKCVFLVFGCSLIFSLFAPYLFSAVYPSEYSSAKSSLYPLIFSQAFLFISNSYNQILYRVSGAFIASVFSAFGALISVLFSYILIFKFGIFGAAASFLIAEISVAGIKGLYLYFHKIKLFTSCAVVTVSCLLFFVSFLFF
jgi:O-antigen/teichoic acid export membrane protein